MRIFFIYDTAFCKTDEDDPKNAILYFFPMQMNENQYYSLCCQIVGIAKFLQNSFSSPSFIALDHGKFALHWSGKYLLVLGEDSDIHQNVLKKHLLFLCGIFCFYHGSLNNLLKICSNNRELFSAKMELAWSRYITFTGCFNNLLHAPVNTVPITFFKNHADAVAKAKQLLHLCQMSAFVVAGAVFCNSRILSSQLPPEITNYLTLMSNSNACAPVENVESQAKILPPDVELKYVYLNDKVMQSIIKYNHSLVGTSIRVKPVKTQTTEAFPKPYKSENSGSEGDIDSGNYTENPCSKTVAVKKEKDDIIKFNVKSLLLCCSMHAAMLREFILMSQNRSFSEYLNLDFISEKLKAFKEKTSSNMKMDPCTTQFYSNITEESGTSFHLLCHYHAKRLSSYFHSKSIHRHTNFSSTCDLEYSCYFCINHRFSSYSTCSLKNWNSFMHIPNYVWSIPNKDSTSESILNGNKHKKRKTSKCKIQILKCRTKCNTCEWCLQRNKMHPSEYKTDSNFSAMTTLRNQPSKKVLNNFGSIEKYWENIEKNDLQKFILYVQRCGNNIILLLLNKNYDKDILMYLWNCGFEFFSNLGSGEKYNEEGNELEPVPYIMIYDDIKKVLRGNPYDSVFGGKHIKETVQTIQDYFQLNPKFHMCSILSANESIFACQAKQQCAFYLQKDLTSKKVESLCSLSRKAVRRLEKYFKFSV